jgi:DNA repair protein RAD5
MEISRLETPEPHILLAEEISTVQSVLGSEYTDSDIIRALNACGNNPNRAINALLDFPKREVFTHPVRSNASVGSFDKKVSVKKEEPEFGKKVSVKKEESEFGMNKPTSHTKIEVKKEKSELVSQQNPGLTIVKEEQPNFISKTEEINMSSRKVDSVSPLPGETVEEYLERRRKNKPEKKESEAIMTSNDPLQNLTTSNPLPYLNPRPIRAIRPPDCVVSDRKLQVVPDPNDAELGDFPEEHDWFLVGKTYVAGLSTCRGKRMLDAGEVVHFAFPSTDRDFGGVRVRPKTAAAISAIVRFSTKRSGEVSSKVMH